MQIKCVYVVSNKTTACVCSWFLDNNGGRRSKIHQAMNTHTTISSYVSGINTLLVGVFS